MAWSVPPVSQCWESHVTIAPGPASAGGDQRDLQLHGHLA